MPFWHGDRPGRPLELGRALGGFIREIRELPRAAGRSSGCESTTGSTPSPPTTCCCTWTSSSRRRVSCPTTARSWSSGSGTRSATGGCACSSPFGTPVHAPVGDGDRAAADGSLRSAGRDDVGRRRHRHPTARVGRRAAARGARDRPRRDRRARGVDPAADVAVLGPVPRVRRAGAAAPAPPARPNGRRCGSSASGPPICSPWRPSTRRSRSCSRPAGSACRTCSTCRPCGRCSASSAAAQIRLRERRHGQGLAVQPEPAVQLDRRLHVRGRRAAGRAPGRPRSALDRDLLRDLLGAEELRELLDPGVLADLELELQCLTDGRRARTADELHDVLRRVGDLTIDEADLRCDGGTGRPRLARRAGAGTAGGRRRASAGEERYIAAEDAARYRDAFGCALPVGLPAAFTEPVPRPLEELVGRYARTHGPFLTDGPTRRFDAPAERVVGALQGARGGGPVVRGEFRPDGVEREWCDDRRAAPAAAPVARRAAPRGRAGRAGRARPGSSRPGTASRPSGVGSTRSSRRSAALQGAAIVGSTLESDVLPARVQGYRTADLDELCTSGDIVWLGAGAIGSGDGRVRLYFRDQLALLAAGRRAGPERPSGPCTTALRSPPRANGAPASGSNCGCATLGRRSDAEVLTALWDLVWAGEVTNDSLAPLRAGARRGKPTKRGGGPRPRRPGGAAPARAAHCDRPARRRRPLVAGRAAAGAGAPADRGRPRGRPATARASRRA